MTHGIEEPSVLDVPAHLRFVEVDDHLIVYDPEREQAHLLNHSAVAVWLEARSKQPTPQLIDALADRYDIGADQIGPDIERAVADLLDKGLLVQQPSEDESDPRRAGAASHSDPIGPDERHQLAGSGRSNPANRPPGPGREPVVRARALDVEVSVWSDHDLLTLWLKAVLDPLATDPFDLPPPPAPRAPLHLLCQVEEAPVEPEDLVTIVFDDEKRSSPKRPSDAASNLLWRINREVIERTSRHLLLHASAVATDEGVLALPAVSNSGKSTLATALVRAGYRYVTDEALAIDPDTLEVEPYPKPIGLDPGSFPLFPDLEPTADELPPDLFHDKWWLDPRRISPLGADAIAPPDLPLRAVVFPTYVADAEPTLEPVEAAEGVILLARNAFNLKRWGQQGLDLLAEIATTVPLYRMTHNDLATSLDLLYGVIGPPPRLGDDADH